MAGGIRNLAYLQIGKETVKGTAVAASRRFAPALASTFQPDFMQNFHENRSTGRRNPITYATSMGTICPVNKFHSRSAFGDYCLYCERTMKPERPNTEELDRKSTRLNSSHSDRSRMPSSA